MMKKWLLSACFGAALLAAGAAPASAQAFNWQNQKGTTINLLLNNHPWSQAMRDLAKEFTAKTGIETRIEIFNEEQFRARLATLMQARSADIDVYMSLASREGQVYDKSGWFADLNPLVKNAAVTSPELNLPDFSKGLMDSEMINGKLVALPINIEGPLFYWRKDIFAKCAIPEPMAVEDLLPTAEKLQNCAAAHEMGMATPWAGRGIRAAINYSLTGFVNNLGGDYATPDGKPGLCQAKTLPGLELYAKLLKDYGPPGALNHTFTQVVELLGQGKIAMTYESSNEFSNIVRFPGRAQDLGVKPFPPGRATGINKPVVIGWGVSISPNSKKQDAAWMFLQWATSPEVEARLVQNGVAPPRASVFNGAAFKAWTAELPIRQSWADSLVTIARIGTSVYQSPTDRVPEARDLIGGAIQKIVLGQATAKDAACAADAELAKLQ
jgi:multiple sugar transport system substrate-binding protein